MSHQITFYSRLRPTHPFFTCLVADQNLAARLNISEDMLASLKPSIDPSLVCIISCLSIFLFLLFLIYSFFLLLFDRCHLTFKSLFLNLMSIGLLSKSATLGSRRFGKKSKILSL